MYLLDTNVVSELRKAKSGKANEDVVQWGHKVLTANLFLSVITVLELDIGVKLIERRDKKQGAMLRAWLNDDVLPAFQSRIIPIDTSVALCCADLHVPDPRSDRDALIAATALTHKMTVVTRNTDDFTHMGVELLNPWIKPDVSR